MTALPPRSTLFPYTTLFRSSNGIQWTLNEHGGGIADAAVHQGPLNAVRHRRGETRLLSREPAGNPMEHVVQRKVHVVNESDRKSTRLNSSHVKISYAVYSMN